jgi:hypothetical protein
VPEAQKLKSMNWAGISLAADRHLSYCCSAYGTEDERTDTKMMNPCFGTSLALALAGATVCGLAGDGKLPGADPPQAEISNGQIRVKLYLPDARNGYYRATRFDWSGVIASLEYEGHNYYGPWFNRVDSKVHDFTYEGAEIVASPCTGDTGPVEEFQTNGTALRWDEAKVGGTFIKIGVGVLRKDEGSYDPYKLYDIVDPGKWSVRKHADSIEFTQELIDPSSGYGYVYRKTVRLTKGKPEMVLEHGLKNTGHRTIQSSVYNHNFLVLDKQPPGPDFSITVPFQIHSPQPPNPQLAQIRGNQLVYLKGLENQEVMETPLLGFSDSPQDNEIRIENRKVGAGMRISGDRPLSFANLWSIRSVLAVEPFITMTIDPGSEFTWTMRYVYYTLQSNMK